MTSADTPPALDSWLHRLNPNPGPPLVTAVAAPCDATALAAAVEAARAGLIRPILIGPRAAIVAAADAARCDIAAFETIDVRDDVEAASRAVAEVVAGRAGALMKGSLHTDVLLSAVLAAPSLRTGRRMSHCYVIALGASAEPLILTDTVMNVLPNLDAKADIVRNAIDLGAKIGLGPLRVAILSAIETVNPRIPSTVDAAALAKMADRGQIVGALVDGPLALDDALDPQAAALKKIASPVAGRANILVVPDLEAGNILVKELEFVAHADVAGIVLGASVPIILTSRAETVRARVASCALAAHVAAAMVC